MVSHLKGNKFSRVGKKIKNARSKGFIFYEVAKLTKKQIQVYQIKIYVLIQKFKYQ